MLAALAPHLRLLPILSLGATTFASLARAEGPFDTDAFRVDPWARPRPGLISGRDIRDACAGLAALREAGMACPLDLQLALRGLPDLAQTCAATDGGTRLPLGGFAVPHPLTVDAAVEAARRAQARISPRCTWLIEASREGEDLRVSVPEASGVVELRLGWRLPDTDKLTWLRPMDGAETPVPGRISRRALLDRALPGSGQFDLVIDMIDGEAGTTRLVLPAELPLDAGGPVDLGPAFEVSVGAEGEVFPLAALGIQTAPLTENHAPTGYALLDGGRVGPEPALPELPLSPEQGATFARWCRSRPGGLQATALSPQSCALLGAAEGRATAPGEGIQIALRRAAVDDLCALPRNLGEELLRLELASPSRTWYRLDGAISLAAAGATLEALFEGAPAQMALAAWARNRGPRWPDGSPQGRGLGFFEDADHAATPMAATFYLMSLLAAIAAPDEVADQGDGVRVVRPEPLQAGALTLAATVTLSRKTNLPGGLQISWADAPRPMVGMSDIPWVEAMGRHLAQVSADQRLRLLDAHHSPIGGAERAAAAGRALFQDLDAVLGLLPLASTEADTQRRERRAALDALFQPLFSATIGWGRGSVAEIAAGIGLLAHDPTLTSYLPGGRERLEQTLDQLLRLTQTHSLPSGHNASPTAFAGLAFVVDAETAGLGASIPLGLTWSRPLRNGGELGLTPTLLDLGAPFVSGQEPSWERLFAPGIAFPYRPGRLPIGCWPYVQLAPSDPSGAPLRAGLALGRTLAPLSGPP